MPTIGHPAVQAVAAQVVHLVDVDRSRQNRTQQAAIRGIGAGHQNVQHLLGCHTPLRLQHPGERAAIGQELGRKDLVGRQAGQLHVLDRMAIRPVTQVVQQRGHQQYLDTVPIHDLAEPRIASQLPDVLQCVVVHAQGVFEPRVRRTGIDSRNKTQLRDLPEPLKLGRVHQRPDPGCERYVLLDRNPHDSAAGFQVGQLGNVTVGMLHPRNYTGKSRPTPGRVNNVGTNNVENLAGLYLSRSPRRLLADKHP